MIIPSKVHTQVTALAALCAIFASCKTSLAAVTLTVDSTTTVSSTSFPGSPTIALAAPNQGNVAEGALVTGIAFFAPSSFNLGAIEYQPTNTATFTLALYDLGTTVSGTNPRYNISGANTNLLSTGTTVFTQNAGFSRFNFTGVDQVPLIGGHYYSLEALSSGSTASVGMQRASTALNAFLALGTAPTGARTDVPAGDRDPVGAIYAVPEASSMALIGLSAFVSTFVRRRRR